MRIASNVDLVLIYLLIENDVRYTLCIIFALYIFKSVELAVCDRDALVTIFIRKLGFRYIKSNFRFNSQNGHNVQTNLSFSNLLVNGISNNFATGW